MPTLPVWDRFIRAFHWALVASIAVAAATGFLLGAEALAAHLIAGLAAAALVLSRLIWGVWGGAAARFASFVPTPAAVMAHLRGLRGGGARYLGHNPLGALMVLALIAVILLIAVTGLMVLGGALKTGPLAMLSYDLGDTAKELHEALAIALLVMVAAHIGGVIFESRHHGENLTRSMISGAKPARPGDIAPAPVPARPGRALAAGAVAALTLAGGAAALMGRPVPGAPVAAWDDTTRTECTACHIGYHPSLLPAARWQALMGKLDDHFGEDARLPPATTAAITDWLVAHAAETADTLPAHRLARVDAAAPFTLTETPFWKRRHGEIPDAVFARPAIKSRANCAACHADAETGWFSPLSIDIPKETLK